ncbi:hypothetical protein OROGR_013764 [Orobanche gracilis]
MRAGSSSIQRTLTPEAAAVLKHSIAEAVRRNHGQTTPLHVAATLLASTSGYLRQACIRSHPNSSHPLMWRALDLCFSVDLERLPSVQNTAAPATEPELPISNALMAALKRAQAHQRRGGPEQQQQPLLPVKVELDQLIVSILDDPSVSRVMREAGFYSPAVKATIEQSLTSSSSNPHRHHSHHRNQNIAPATISNPAQLSTPFMQKYLNTRLQQDPNAKTGNQRGHDEINKLLDIMMRSKKRNPILVGDSEPKDIVKELFKKIENKELGNDGHFKNARVVLMENDILTDKLSSAQSKIEELRSVVDNLIGIGSVIVDLGGLEWLVDHQAKPQMITENGKGAVDDMAKLVARFGENEDYNVWLVGTATCETYLRCLVYPSTIESDWDLQAMPMTSRSRFPKMLTRFGSVGGDQGEPALTRRTYEDVDPCQRRTICPQCLENYEKELTKLEANIEKSFSEANQSSLPQWLRNAGVDATDSEISDKRSQEKDRGLIPEQKTKEMENKWRDTCLRLHPYFHRTRPSPSPPRMSLSMTNLYDRNLPEVPVLKPLKESMQLSTSNVNSRPANSLPESPVRTDLVLGMKGTSENFMDKFANTLDAGTYKKLRERLVEKAWWQAEAASAVASAVTRCRSGNGKRLRADIWLLFAGPDKLGKKKMASALAEQICRGRLITICLGARRDDGYDGESNIRGKMTADRITEAVRKNPFSVIMLDSVDEAGEVVLGSLKWAIERGRLTDSHGREVGTGNVIFVLGGDWSTNNHHGVGGGGRFFDEKRNRSWRLELTVRERIPKRRAGRLEDEDDRMVKARRELLSFDLNISADEQCDKTDGSDQNTSDVTVDHEDEISIGNRDFSVASVPRDLLDCVDDSITFRPFDYEFVLGEMKRKIYSKLSVIVDDESLSLEVEDDVLEKIVGGILHDEMSLEEWIGKVLVPSFDRLKQRLSSDRERRGYVVHLVVESDFQSIHGQSKDNENWLNEGIELIFTDFWWAHV